MPMDNPRIIDSRFEILDSLGRGGFASVFKVKDLQTGEVMALKHLANSTENPLDARRFEREFQYLSRLRHDHIVSVKDTGTDGDACYFTMEFLEGVTLDAALKAPGTGLYEVLQKGSVVFREIMIQLCEGLACIHANGLIHRDLKPSNIFLLSDQNGPHAKILDLGLAKFRGEDPSPLTEIGIMLGTVHYMSPEQIKGVHVDHRADLYTLGVVLYEILTGQKPFMGQNSAAVVLKHLNEIPVPPRVYNLDVPQDLQLVVMRLLEKEPERRYRFADDLLADLVGSKSRIARRAILNDSPHLLQHPRFLGRPDEMAIARKLLGEVQAGKGRLLRVSGQAGIGKTRFLSEIRAEASLRGMEVIHSSCFVGHNAPFQPIIECIRSAEKKLGGLSTWVREEDRNELARIFPELGEVAVQVHRSNLIPLDQDEVFLSIFQLLKDLTRRSSLLFLIDDMHWVDQGTSKFIDFLLERLDNVPVLVCLGHRTIDADSSSWLNSGNEVRLEPFGFEASKSFLMSIFNSEDIPEDFCVDVYKVAGGNAFVTLEITKALYANKSITWKNNEWNYVSTVEKMPAEVEAAIAMRLSFLTQKDRKILCLIAIANRPIDFDLISSIVGSSENKTFDQLERLAQNQFLRKDSKEKYQIFHNLIAETLCRQIPREETKKLHLNIAEALEYSNEASDLPGEMAYHLMLAGNESEAWPYLVKAGDRACVAYAFSDAVDKFGQALTVLTDLYELTSETYLA
jgi:eukaryotic-like serine/threonine-protein kinase